MTHHDARSLPITERYPPRRIRALPPVFWLAILVVVEFGALYWIGSGRYNALRLLEPGWKWLLPVHQNARYAALWLGMLAVAAHVNRDNRRLLLRKRPGAVLIVLHIVSVVAVLALQQGMPQGAPQSAADVVGMQRLYLPAVALFLLATGSGFLLLVPLHRLSVDDLRVLLSWAKRPAMGTLLLTVLIASRDVGNRLNQAEFVRFFAGIVEGTTLDLSLFFYTLPGFEKPDIYASTTGDPILAYGSFAIEMAPSCAGYQGMMTALAVLSLVLVLDWRRLHLPRALVFALCTVGVVFVMNAVRIAILLYIGIHISEEVAVGGFHSYFGTLSLLVIVGIALVALQHPVFERAPTPGLRRPVARPLADHADLVPLITPLAIMLAVSFAVGAVQGEFNWLYFVATFVGAGLMWVVRDRILWEMVGSPTPAGLLCGVGVYVLWIALIPPDPERAAIFDAAFGSVAAPVVIAWIVIRVLGSSIVVPVLEELAFRAGLQRLIARVAALHLGRRNAMVIAVAFSSLAFGLMHADILAATLAGLAYGALAAWRGRVGDAIVAHAVTNFLIAMHVLALGEWSYW